MANAPLGPAVAAINQAMQSLHMPPTIQASFQGNAQAFQASLSSTPILIVAALIAVYIILGMLYENTIHPLTIISTLPSAGAGALLVLLLFGFGLDVMGIIGIILLIGIVKKNGIMLVDFALEAERHHGLTPEQSIYEACRLRFRPILMTTMCALLGGLPLMLEQWHRFGAAPATRLCHGRRPGGVPDPDLVHYTGGLHLHGAPVPLAWSRPHALCRKKSDCRCGMRSSACNFPLASTVQEGGLDPRVRSGCTGRRL